MDAHTKAEQPEGLDPDEAERLLKGTSGEPDLGRRLERISERFLGRPYMGSLLGGGPELPEVFRVSLVAFDCVTYMETVLALGLARTLDEFIDTIRQIRYADGRIDWFHRNHFMVDWARNNEKQGFVNNLTDGPATVQKDCRLGMVPGLPVKSASFAYFPKPSLQEVLQLVNTGDLILFVSARETLDVFHTGLLVTVGRRIILRHATRTAGAVIEQELPDFVSKNEMAGFILLRPLCRH